MSLEAEIEKAIKVSSEISGQRYWDLSESLHEILKGLSASWQNPPSVQLAHAMGVWSEARKAHRDAGEALILCQTMLCALQSEVKAMQAAQVDIKIETISAPFGRSLPYPADNEFPVGF